MAPYCDSVKINVKVKTRSSQNRLSKSPDGTYIAYLSASPVKGRANRALIELLSEEFDIAKGLVRIVKGMTSKNKIVSLGE